jgi:hypothetical protein
MAQEGHGGWAPEHRKNNIYSFACVRMSSLLVSVEELLFIVVVAGAALAIIVYLLFRMLEKKNKIKEEIKRMFNAKEQDGDLRFSYRNYEVLVTFRPDVKVSILHDRDVEDVKSPQGAQLTPMYLIFKVKKSEELAQRLDAYIDFLNSIPTQ